MVDTERRSRAKPLPVRLMRDLNEAQRVTLETLEKFGWQLKFVRHPLFKPVVPVLYDPDHNRYVALAEDGSLDEANPVTARD